MGESKVKTVTDICEAAGIARATYFIWNKEAGFPKHESAERRLEWILAYKNGAMSDDGEAPDQVNWSIEQKKWAALKAKQQVESERVKIVLAAREDVLAGIVEVFEKLQRRIVKVTRNDPEMAQRLNEEIEKAIDELIAMDGSG